MKNPGRLLRITISGLHFPKSGLVHPLMAAGGLCAVAAIVFFWTDESPGRVTAIQTETAHSSGGKNSNKQSNSRTRAADPSRALTHAFTLENRSERESRVRDLLSEWAVRDAEAALNWVSSLKDSAARCTARSTVCLVVTEEDPRRAIVLALTHDADQDDDLGLLECLTMQWCEKDTADAVDWAQEQPPGEWRERLLSRVSFVLSKSDPAAAAHIVSCLEPGTVQDEAAMAVLHQWALQDSSAALRWAEQFSEPTLRERALAETSNLRDPMISHE